VTVRQAAERLEVSPQLVYALIGAGRLRCTRHGLGRGCIRVSEEQLAAYLEEAERRTMPLRSPSHPAGLFKHLNDSRLRQAWKSHV
jgi:excisionase family DNA binding protein